VHGFVRLRRGFRYMRRGGASRGGLPGIRPSGVIRFMPGASIGTGTAGHFARSTGQALAELQRDVVVQRAGMCLLIGDAQFGQHVDNDIRLYFQFARQLVNSNLAHR